MEYQDPGCLRAQSRRLFSLSGESPPASAMHYRMLCGSGTIEQCYNLKQLNNCTHFGRLARSILLHTTTESIEGKRREADRSTAEGTLARPQSQTMFYQTERRTKNDEAKRCEVAREMVSKTKPFGLVGCVALDLDLDFRNS